MASDNINVRIRGELQDHLKQQIGESGTFENASEYIRSLIRADLQSRTQSWEWLKKQLEPAMRAKENDFVAVSGKDVIARNSGK